MELQRRVLLVTWAFLLILNVAIHAEEGEGAAQGTSYMNVDIESWFRYINNTELYREYSKPPKVSSLLGLPESCVKIEFFMRPNVEEGTVGSLFADFKNTSGLDGWELELDIYVNASREGGPNDTIIFDFNYTYDEFKNRKVEYILLSANYTSKCSILKTSAGQDCWYWVLYTGEDDDVPENCRPANTEECDVEKHTRKQPSECEDEIEDGEDKGDEDEDKKDEVGEDDNEQD
uniref:Putative secreted protein n=1 Tax=Ixodes ricinus TaxID=34613 RepID=A0A090X9L5_IXORI